MANTEQKCIICCTPLYIPCGKTFVDSYCIFHGHVKGFEQRSRSNAIIPSKIQIDPDEEKDISPELPKIPCTRRCIVCRNLIPDECRKICVDCNKKYSK